MAQPQYVDLKLPAGCRVLGTSRQSKGYIRDQSLTRWTEIDPLTGEGNLQPILGWSAHASGFTGSARAIVAWKENAGNRWAAIGTNTKLWAMSAGGTLSDITPIGFTAGRADAATGTGYGMGAFGVGLYGTPRTDSSSVNDAAVWTLDTWDQDLVGCMGVDGGGDGKCYTWTRDPAVKAVAITNAPTGCTGLVVTADKILMALKERSVIWSDQGDNTIWTPTTTNQAGDQALDTFGILTFGKKAPGCTLIFTTTDVWRARYLGTPFVYGFDRVSDSPPISKGAAVGLVNEVLWMGRGGFYAFNGYTQTLPCAVADKVFSDINWQQASKIAGWNNTRFGEVWWQYPSAGSTEIDRYVAYSYKHGFWMIGALARTCGAPAGVFSNPLLCGADGKVYDHENGFNYDGATPFARTGPLELGSGDQVLQIMNVIPDERTLGDSQVIFYSRFAPNGTETVSATYPVSGAPVNVRVTGRQIEMRFEFVANDDARIGDFRLQMAGRGRR